jgi:hypothetical protein
MKLLAPSSLAMAVIAALASAGCSPAPEKTAAKAPAPAPPATLPAPPPVQPIDPALDAWVREYVKDGTLPLRYASASTTGPDNLIAVYLIGGDYCGSGGCTLLILRKSASLYERLGRLTVARPPIRVLQSRTDGLPDLAVSVAGGGGPAHEALIPFDGRRYASNPTVAPAREVEGDAPGQTLITDDTPKVTVRE